MNNFKKLKVGIIVDDVQQPYLINDLYQNSLDSSRYSIEALIIQKTNKIKKNIFQKIINYIKRKGFNRLVDHFLFDVITKVEIYFIKQSIIRHWFTSIYCLFLVFLYLKAFLQLLN